MMENYFVVLQLPGSKELNFTEGNSRVTNFWGRAANAVRKGKARIISRRQDTGVSEELRSHSKKVKRFKTYVLVNMRLARHDKKEAIFAKAAECISLSSTAAVVETTEDFQLLAISA
jgi:hypothetical protein